MKEMGMRALNLPAFDYKLQDNNNQLEIFDLIRKKYVRLTPEEWVRQHFVHYLISHMGYPKSLIQVEKGLQYHKMAKRWDIVIFKRDGTSFMVVECKAPSVKLTQATFDQVACYNQSLKADYLTVTNGMVHFSCKIDHAAHRFKFLEKLPDF